jgi:CP family cyanate transporter-like MFS transporter
VTTAEAAAPRAVARRDGFLLLGALLLAAVALRPQLVGAGPLVEQIQDDLGVSHSVVGLVATIPVLCMGLFAPLAGQVSGRWGLRAAMAGCLLVIAAAGLGRAVAPGIVVLLALTFPIGIAMAIAGTLLPVAVKQRFAHRPAFASGIGVTGINLGAAVSSALAVPIAAAWEGWRGAFAAFSLATLAICAGWLALSRGAWTERSTARPPRLPWGRPIAWAIVLAFGLPSAVYYGLVAWIADVYVERGWSDGSAGAVLAVMGVASVPAAFVVPWLADRMGSRRGWMWFAAGALGIATLGFAALPGGAFAWAVCTGIGLGTVFPICLTMCLDIARVPAEAGAAAALMFLAGYPIAALGPLGAGAIRDLSGSFDASLWGMFGVTLVMAVALVPLSARRLRPEGG